MKSFFVKLIPIVFSSFITVLLIMLLLLAELMCILLAVGYGLIVIKVPSASFFDYLALYTVIGLIQVIGKIIVDLIVNYSDETISYMTRNHQ